MILSYKKYISNNISNLQNGINYSFIELIPFNAEPKQFLSRIKEVLNDIAFLINKNRTKSYNENIGSVCYYTF